MNKLTAKNLSKTFQSGEEQIEVFNIKEFSVSESETVAIKGASGSGKSTFLQIMAGLDSPTNGHVFLSGSISKEISGAEMSDIHSLKEKQSNKLRKNNFGFIYQKNFLLKDLSVLDNLLIVNNDKEQALSLLEEVGLKDKANRYHNQLSGGEKQRVSICRALMNNPSFVFADEPTGALDYHTKEKIWDLFKKMQEKYNFGLIMVTHDDDMAKKCENNYIFKEGDIKKLKKKE